MVLSNSYMPIPLQEYKAIREDILRTVIEAAEAASVTLPRSNVRRFSHEDFISHLSKSLTPSADGE